ncbi:biofilm development regulator YmgB/AriR family protein [Enterobacter asburiae]|uniref:biofilm development regulator YmgB/AriR family protein n=1 Tax=unclassified Scandinavium TaxID=2830652 RepID=UPI0028A0B5E7|nr:biofilm development regulator YmgB/AriR family protein [Scandinavium sp.]
MIQQPDIYSALADNALSDYFRHAGDILAEESVALGAAIRNVIIAGESINNKNIMLALIRRLESTEDVVQADVIRKTIEIVVGHTMDDI